MSGTSPKTHDRLLYARVLVELGELQEAEREVADILDSEPKNLSAFNLLAKVKHMRGELSQAIACWAQIHAQAPHNEHALMALGSILQMVKDPARGVSEFVALGQYQLARKPAAVLELEKAFTLFLARKPTEARAICERLAQTDGAKDHDLLKLAHLASAWIAEMSGDPDAACHVLEQLGSQRGFETDTDRVLALARIYERLGTPARLRQAVHIFHFFDRSFEKLSALGHLAVLYRKLGDDALAKEYESRYAAAFRRRMHRVSTADVAHVAAARYLPLEELRRIRATDSEAPRGSPDPSPRERAIEVFLQGDARSARELFSSEGALLDEKYLANLSVLEGDVARGLERFIRVLEEDPDDLRVLGEIVAHRARSGSDPLDRRLAQAPLHPRLVANVEVALQASPLDASLWRALGVLQAVVGRDADAARCAGRAEALRAAAERDTHTVGRVLAAAVFHFIGKAKGVVHQIWVDRTPTESRRGGFIAAEDILGNVTLEMKQNIRSTFFAVREYARSRFPQQTHDILDFSYTYKATKDDEPSGGLSAGLPTALAFLSVFLQRPVPQDMVYSGMLVADAHDVLVVRRIGEAEYKVKGAYNRGLRTIVLPAENRADLLGSPEVPVAICDEIVRYARSFDDAVTLTFGSDVWTR